MKRILISFLINIKRLVNKIISSVLLRVNSFQSNLIVCKGVFLSRKNRINIKGKNIYIGRYCHVGTNITIFSDVMIASSVSFVGGDHKFEEPSEVMFHSGRAMQLGVIIRNNVWIGHGAIILDGVTLSEGSIVGAGSIVTKSFPPFSIIAGNPAKLIRNRL
ncbi:acyltransferase [uncultured Psychrosphaera sp.]|uniref:acyltransferase n=1 Tax=uncultured Psychrosphaera sp. TaxID=1403522 RepID=UPI00263537E5|nr:acyltransferase [uncultured Psychrosphaera sp.]